MQQFTTMFRSRLPKLCDHITNVAGDIWMFPCMWISPLFANLCCPLSLIERLWDIFFVQKVDFLLNFVIAMFIKQEQTILSLGPSTLCEYVKSLPTKFNERDIQDLIILAVKHHSVVLLKKFNSLITL